METAEYFRKAIWDYLEGKERGAQSQLALNSGIEIKHLNDFLAGRRAMKEPLRFKITDYLECDYLDFLQKGKALLEGKSQLESSSKVVPLDPAIQLLHECIKEAGADLNEKQKQAVAQVIREELKEAEEKAKKETSKRIATYIKAIAGTGTGDGQGLK